MASREPSVLDCLADRILLRQRASTDRRRPIPDVRKRPLRLRPAAIALASLALAIPALGLEGDFDDTFSDHGVFVLDTAIGFETAHDVAVGDDGTVYTLFQHDHAGILALDEHGQPMTDFGTDGIMTINLALEQSPRSSASTPAGDLIVAGSSLDPITDVDVPWIAKVTPGGTLDNTFGFAGETFLDTAGAFEHVSVDDSGRIIAVGYTGQSGLAARFDATGALDPTFGTDGIVTVDGLSNGRSVHGAVDHFGRIVMAGATNIGTGSDVFVVRLHADGSFDEEFGTVVVDPLGQDEFDRPSAVVISTSGRIVVAGFAEGDGVTSFIIRLRDDGSLDLSMGGLGHADFAPEFGTTAVEVMVDGADRIVAVGNLRTGGMADNVGFAVRFLPNGLPDTGFGLDGVIRIDASGGRDFLTGVAMQDDGRLLVVGRTGPNADNRLLVARLDTTTPEIDFSDDDGSIFEDDIEAIAAVGITLGCDEALYCPGDLVTRGQMAAFLVRGIGYTDSGPGDLFADDDGSIFEDDIDRLATAGVTFGCDVERFCPEDHVTRGQMAAFLVRALGFTDGLGDDRFVDDDNTIFEADIDRLAAAGVTLGCEPDRFCPNDPVTRGQMAAFLARAFGLGS